MMPTVEMSVATFYVAVIVEEKPIVSSVVIEENHEVDSQDLREVITVKERAP